MTPLAAGRTTGSRVVGDGSTTNLTYCTTPDGRATVAGTAKAGEQIKVAVTAATSTDCSTPGASQLPSGTDYSVAMNNATGTGAPFTFDGTHWNIVAGTGCFKSPTPPATVITLGNANFTVDATGAGNATYTLPTTMTTNNVNGDASSVCVGKSGGSGIFAPLQIVTV